MTGPKLSRIDMDAVAPLMPHDKTAAVVGGKGVHYEFKPSENAVHSETPLPTRSPSHSDLGKLGQAIITLLQGAQTGRLKVIGIAAEARANDRERTRWVVRCVCGAYEHRRTSYLRRCVEGGNPDEHEPMCDWCHNTQNLQLGIGKPDEERKWRSVLGEDFPS